MDTFRTILQLSYPAYVHLYCRSIYHLKLCLFLDSPCVKNSSTKTRHEIKLFHLNKLSNTKMSPSNSYGYKEDRRISILVNTNKTISNFSSLITYNVPIYIQSIVSFWCNFIFNFFFNWRRCLFILTKK